MLLKPCLLTQTCCLPALFRTCDAYMPAMSPPSVKRTVFSRCFINFNTAQDVVDFKTRFEGHLFVSARGTQYRSAGQVPLLNPLTHTVHACVRNAHMHNLKCCCL
jgi:hypothetical protein